MPTLLILMIALVAGFFFFSAARAAAERATDAIRAKFGAEAIIKGRALR